MQIHLSPKHLVLTGAIHGYVAEKISHLEAINDRILAAHVVLVGHESKKPSYTVKVHLAVPGPDLHAEESNPDLYAAIDKVAGKLAQQLRKRKTQLVDKTKSKAQRAAERVKRG